MLLESDDGSFDVANVAYIRGDGFDRQRGGSGLERTRVKDSPAGCRVRIDHECDPGDRGCNLFKNSQPLAGR